ncbi:hypothetical protein [Halalkalibacillus halophilus]|uniref:hypothetical protein n=1 Tax=Halalkalibacillus halophilus TaxID=392827 RepID=UPI0004015F79|nr:hypothetical protein [Halalkalibacillus halophilus]
MEYNYMMVAFIILSILIGLVVTAYKKESGLGFSVAVLLYIVLMNLDTWFATGDLPVLGIIGIETPLMMGLILLLQVIILGSEQEKKVKRVLIGLCIITLPVVIYVYMQTFTSYQEVISNELQREDIYSIRLETNDFEELARTRIDESDFEIILSELDMDLKAISEERLYDGYRFRMRTNTYREAGTVYLTINEEQLSINENTYQVLDENKLYDWVEEADLEWEN